MSNRTRSVRFAVTMVGGTSLAIYIHGVALELLDMVNGGEDAKPNLYGVLKELTQSDTYVDILSGTSAGGLNAIFLAAALANRTPMESIKRLFMNKADIDKLMNNPWEGNLDSLFRGNDFYYPELYNAVASVLGEKKGRTPGRYASGYDKSAQYSDIDVFITGTFHRGQPRTYFDAQDLPLFTRDYRGVFKLKHRSDCSHFVENQPDSADGSSRDLDFQTRRLARVARTTSSLPALFEPSKVVGAEMGDVIDLTHKQEDYEYMMDGGYLNGRPLNLIVEAMNQKSSDGRIVDRKVLLVEPKPDDFVMLEKKPASPSAVEDLLFFRDVPTRQELTAFLDEVEKHNRNVKRVQETLGLIRAQNLALSQAKIEDPPPTQKSLWAKTCILEILETVSKIFRRANQLDGFGLPGNDYRAERSRRSALETLWKGLETFLTPVLNNEADQGTLQNYDICFLHRKALRAIDEVYAIAGEHQKLANVEPCSEELYGILREAVKLRTTMENDLVELFLDQTSGVVPAAGNAPGLADTYCRRLQLYVVGQSNHIREISQRINDCLSRGLGGMAPVVVDADAAGVHLKHLDEWAYPIERSASLLSRDELRLMQVDPRQQLGLCSRAASDKVAGDELAKLGGFLNGVWRRNDVLWGRLDGSCSLIRALLDQNALNAAASQPGLEKFVEGYLGITWVQQGSQSGKWSLVQAAFASKPPKFDSPAAEALADLLATRHHLEVLKQELPELLQSQAEQTAAWNLGAQSALSLDRYNSLKKSGFSDPEIQQLFEKHYSVGSESYRDIPLSVNLRRLARMLYLAYVVAVGSLNGRRVSDRDPKGPRNRVPAPGWATPVGGALKPLGLLLGSLDIAAYLMAQGVAWLGFVIGIWVAALGFSAYQASKTNTKMAVCFLALAAIPALLTPPGAVAFLLGCAATFTMWVSPHGGALLVLLCFTLVGLSLLTLGPPDIPAAPFTWRWGKKLGGLLAALAIAAVPLWVGFVASVGPGQPGFSSPWKLLGLGVLLSFFISRIQAQGSLTTFHAPKGIVSFELCRDEVRANQILQSWDARQRRAAIRGIVWDFPMALTYGALLATFSQLYMRPEYAFWFSIAAGSAVLLDFRENYCMLLMLQPALEREPAEADTIWWLVSRLKGSKLDHGDWRPKASTICAALKFLIILVLSLALAGAVLPGAWREFTGSHNTSGKAGGLLM